MLVLPSARCGNFLSNPAGPIPTEIGQLSQLVVVQLSSNGLTGGVPLRNACVRAFVVLHVVCRVCLPCDY